MAVVTISREVASGGSEIAGILSERLGFRLLDRTGLEALLPSYGLDEHNLLALERLPDNPAAWDQSNLKLYLQCVNACISDLAEWENFILLGRGGQCLFEGAEDALHVRIVGSERVRVERLTSMEGLTREEARAAVESRGNLRNRYIRLLFGKPVDQALLYDLILRRDHLDIQACVEVIIHTFGQRSMRVQPAGESLQDQRLQPSKPLEQADSPVFANQSEEEFARLLDYYHIRWCYEPTTFPLSFNKEGLLSEALSPDFYLEDYDTYIELTTLRQSLVTKKNRKIRRLKELYPDVKVRLFYRRDYQQLLAKYGLIEKSERRKEDTETTEGKKRKSPK